ncbi:MAG: CPBP family intramembrane metalloprotease [Planctomycetes bacterium]|nr:CPBP family intramembrane metalloprotease [Planctomycetota bacterium]
MKQVFILCSFAGAFWFLMFSPWTAHAVNFWLAIMIATGFLAGTALWFGRKGLADIFSFKISYLFIALAGAFLLYIIFWASNLLFSQLLPFTASQVDSIYKPRENSDLLKIALILFFWVGPAEEIFWRGFVQRKLQACLDPKWAYIWAAVIYTFVHIWGFNLMLLGAAMVGAIVWGAMFYRFKSIWPGLICHAVWDVAIFVIWPIQ